MPYGCAYMFNRTIGCLVVVLLCVGFYGQSTARVAGVRQDFPQLKDFRRIELRVSPDFEAKCTVKGAVTQCRLSELPHDFSRLMVSLRGSKLAAVQLKSRKKNKILVRFELRRTDLSLQQAVIGTPPLWVIELGPDELLMGLVQEQLPFRPYPIESAGLPNRIPDIAILALPNTTSENKKFNRCLKFWDADELVDAQAACADLAAAFDGISCGGTARCFETVDTPGLLPVLEGQEAGRGALLRELSQDFSEDAQNSEAAKRTSLVLAEVLNALMATDDNQGYPETANAIERAEAQADTPMEKGRYALLGVDVLERVGYMNRAEELLARKVALYSDPDLSVYFLAAQARILMQLGEGTKAKRVLRQLRELKSTSPIIGLAVLTLAELGYRQKNYVSSLGLFDSVRATWPRVWGANSTAVFQTAELYMLFGRLDDAAAAYDLFQKSRVKMVPEWLADLRKTELLAARDPNLGVQKFRELALSLPKNEAQDLAFLRQASLLKDRGERKRLIKALSTQPTTAFVFEELVVHSIQLALEDGDLTEAFRFARGFWRRTPDADYLVRASKLFDRVLTLEMQKRLTKQDLYGVLDLFYSEEKQIRKHRRSGYLYLLVAKVLRELGMFEESLYVLQDGLNHKDAKEPPMTTARIYKELGTLLRINKDKFRLREIDSYLDTRFPKQFDDPEYWLIRSSNMEWNGKPKDKKTAREMMVYAINGEISVDDRLILLTQLYEFDLRTGKSERAVKSLKAFIDEYDRAKRPRINDVRSDTLWRISEVWLEAQNWKKAIVSIVNFLREYPDHPNRVEARFLLGRSLQRFGDTKQARMYWDLVAREDENGVFGRLAKLEIELLDWQATQLPDVLNETEL
jgi:tetratricopeptide (TPR) repeat protein